MNLEKIKILYFGTPEFSAKILQGLVDADFNIVGVVTESDKPVGRSQEIIFTPVKATALQAGIDVFQPLDNDELLDYIKTMKPELIVVAIYGRVLKKEVLESPRYGCINFHPSLLPSLRGPSPIRGAILEGLKSTGVTIMKMGEGLDSGPVLTQVEIKLDGTEDVPALEGKVLEYGVPLLLKTIPEYLEGKIEPVPQDDEAATYSKLVTKEDGHIDFEKSAEEEERKFRAYMGWPGSYAFWGEKRVKLININYKAQISPPSQKLRRTGNDKQNSNDQMSKLQNGGVFLDENGDLCVKFAEGYWTINRLQLEGKNPVDAKVFLNGNRDIVGSILK